MFLTAADRARHVYVLGGTGSGKTNLLLRAIEHDAAEGRSIGVLDLRGDLVDRALPRLAARGRKNVVLLDLRQDERTLGIDPLSGPGEPSSRALGVLDALRARSDSWGVQLDETLRHSLIALTEAGLTLLEVEPLLTSEAFLDSVVSRVSDPGARAFFERYRSLSRERRATLSPPVLNKLAPFLAAPRVRRCLGIPGLDVAALMDAPGSTLLVSLAVDRLHGAARLAGSLIVGAIGQAAMARADRPEAERSPFFLYVDEFETMASESFESIVAEGRRFGLALTLSHQNLDQIPTTLRRTIRNNAGAQLFFQTGSLDASDLAGEVVGLGSREAVKTLLLSQRVGEAVLALRGSPAVRVRTLLAEEPAVSPGDLAAFRREALERLSVDRDEAEASIASRTRVSVEPVVAVRHSRRPRATGEGR